MFSIASGQRDLRARLKTTRAQLLEYAARCATLRHAACHMRATSKDRSPLSPQLSLRFVRGYSQSFTQCKAWSTRGGNGQERENVRAGPCQQRSAAQPTGAHSWRCMRSNSPSVSSNALPEKWKGRREGGDMDGQQHKPSFLLSFFPLPSAQAHQCSRVWRMTGLTVASSHRLLLLRGPHTHGNAHQLLKQWAMRMTCTVQHSRCTPSAQHPARRVSSAVDACQWRRAASQWLSVGCQWAIIATTPPAATRQRRPHPPDDFVDQRPHPAPLVTHHPLPAADLAGIVVAAAACRAGRGGRAWSGGWWAGLLARMRAGSARVCA